MLRSVLFLLLLAAPAVHAGDLTDQARTLLRANKRDDAIKVLQDALAKDPADLRAASLLTEVFLVAERFPEADAVINAAIAKSPNASDLHRIRGDLVFREGQIFEAEKEYREGYKLDSRNALVLYGLARCFRSGCQRLGAADLIRSAHELDPQNTRIGNEFQALQPSSPEKIAQLQAMLDSLGDREPEMARGLRRNIAIAKALNGKHAYELATSYEPYQLPLKILSDGHRNYGIGLTVQVGGEKTNLQVDTGAHGILLSGKAAERAGVERLGDVDIGGLGNEGPRKGWVGFAPSVRIGKLELKNCIVDVLDRGMMVGVDGLIGMDILNRFFVKLDFYNRKLDLDPLPGPAWDGYTPVNRYSGPELAGFAQVLIIGHFLLLPTRVSEDVDSDPTPGYFMMDTGASFNNISTTVVGELTKVRDNNTRRIKGLDGNVTKVYEADQLVVQFATFRQRISGLTAIDMSKPSRSAGTEIMGTMGAPLFTMFRSVTIDYRDGMVKFDYKPL